jgi:competence protein ComEC
MIARRAPELGGDRCIVSGMRLAIAVFLAVALAAPAAARTLDIYFIDVEGGQSTLVVTPAGESLLIDAGYGPRAGGPSAAPTNGRDPGRILTALRDAHIDHIDYLLITHFHNDHVGGVPELAAKIPIHTFIDYGMPLGTDRMATNAFRAYEPVRGDNPHIVPQPGDHLALKGLDAVFVSAAGAVLSAPLPEGGQPNTACSDDEDQAEDGTENFRSIGVRLTYGAFRFLNVGDLSGNTLPKLVCPLNLIGHVSVYEVAHHGNYDSNAPAVPRALRPLVAVMDNGALKGGAPESFDTLTHVPGMDLWQLHQSLRDRVVNAPDEFIANVDQGETGYWIKLSATDDGRFTVTNGRTGFTRKYSDKGRGHR